MAHFEQHLGECVMQNCWQQMEAMMINCPLHNNFPFIFSICKETGMATFLKLPKNGKKVPKEWASNGRLSTITLATTSWLRRILGKVQVKVEVELFWEEVVLTFEVNSKQYD